MRRPIEIEPLDKARWDRIERDLRDRLEQEPISVRPRRPISEHPRSSRPVPRNVIAFVLAGAAAALVGALAWEKIRPTQHVAEHTTTSAITRVETQNAPSHVEVGESSLDVASHSVARIEGNDETGVNVSLDHGGIDCEVAPRHGRPPFIVHAGDVTVRVVGTHFHVDREDGVTHVSVQHGAVEVESHGTTTLVRAGSSWPQTAQVAPVETATVVATAAPIQKTTVNVQPTAPVTTATIEKPIPSPRERYDRAITLEASHADEALAIYRELAAGNDSWAMNALYAEARLELERGNKENARKRFAEYLQRYPAGPNANDARELSVKLQ